jgi:four helix bundle protein
MEAFRDLDVWKRACRLSADLYTLTENCRHSSFKDQITRAGLSVASNIAEGYECNSIRRRIQYLNNAKGSCGEVWTRLMVGRSAGFINPEDYVKLELEASETSRILWDTIRQFRKEQEN